ncbi:hypothetical protein J3Q64DRAFT_1834024 [Phycomyces blakesleeanus]
MQISDDLVDVQVPVPVNNTNSLSLPDKNDTSLATTMLESDDALSDTTHLTSSSDNELSQPAFFQTITPIPTTTTTTPTTNIATTATTLNTINNNDDDDDFEDAVFDQPNNLGPTAGFGQTMDDPQVKHFSNEELEEEKNYKSQLFDQDDVFDRDDDGFDQTNDEFDDIGFGQNTGEDEFGDFDNNDFPENDDFGDFDGFDNDLHTDPDFPPEEPAIAVPSEPTEAEIYVKVLEAASGPKEIANHIEHFLDKLWESTLLDLPKPGPNTTPALDSILCTPCSDDLWNKLSRDSVFYNPLTGDIGQFRWTRSETNRAYLNALGVTINYEDRLNQPMRSMSPTQSQGGLRCTSPSQSEANPIHLSSPVSRAERYFSQNHARSASLSGMTVPKDRSHAEEAEGKKEVEEEPELDIDIAKAYCELTEDTIRIFPSQKLEAMMGELTRLQRQASEYLGYLLDQREQLMMDAETYNDLISCIVGHAQRLREQHVGKDSSPAMVKKKKTGLTMSLMRRKPTNGPASYGTSMGGGVVGVKQSTGTQKKPMSAAEGRRSM